MLQQSADFGGLLRRVETKGRRKPPARKGGKEKSMATTINYGMFSVWTQKKTFGNGYFKTFLKSGKVIATAEYDANGKRIRLARNK